MDPDGTAHSLQNKVQFDIRFYLLRRGSENAIDFTKDTFKLITDENTKLKFVIKAIDKVTKNRKTDRWNHSSYVSSNWKEALPCMELLNVHQ